MLSKGGKVTNHELVKHFKSVLTNPETRDDARVKFKEIVNTLATITRDAEGGKQLTLRKKYRNDRSEPSLTLPVDLNLQYTPVYQSPTTDYPDLSRRASQDSLFSSLAFRSPLSSPLTTPLNRESSIPGTPQSGVYLPLGTPVNPNPPSIPPGTPVTPQSNSFPSNAMVSTAPNSQPHTPVLGSHQDHRQQAVRPEQPPPPVPESSEDSSASSDPPPVPPRRRSSDKLRQDLEESSENKENVAIEDSKISVKERSQKFDRMASEVALHKANIPSKKRQEKADRDEEDSGVTLFDAKSREWIVRCAQGDYQAIAKLATDNPKLIKFKDPSSGYTALHWAAKHGNEDLIKLIAGTHSADVNARTNGGYTALHIAMQFGHEEVYSLLTEVYGADQNLRDWSGKKPRQYQTNKGTSVSADTFRSEFILKRSKTASDRQKTKYRSKRKVKRHASLLTLPFTSTSLSK